MSWTTQGTVSVTNGNAIVYGAGTTWASGGKARPGDIFKLGDALYELLSVQSNTQLTLTSPYLGVTASAQSYSLLHIGLLPAELAVGVSEMTAKNVLAMSQLFDWQTSTAATVPLTNPATQVTSQVKPITGLTADIEGKASKDSPVFTGPVTAPQYFNVTQAYGALQVGGIDVIRFGGAAGDNSGQLSGFRNILINSNFQINNGDAGTPYVSGATLAAGQTGHECWKAGANGGDYTFTQNAAITPITLLSGKSLIQVIEDKFVRGGTYILHWTGAAKCRAGINSATPSGAYVTSPLVITGQSKGVTMSIEVFNDGSGGTFEEPQLERSSIASTYEFGADELLRTQRYYQKGALTACGDGVMAYLIAGSNLTTSMRAFPTVTVSDNLGNLGKVSYDNTNNVSAQAYAISSGSIRIQVNGVVIPVNNIMIGRFTASARI